MVVKTNTFRQYWELERALALFALFNFLSTMLLEKYKTAIIIGVHTELTDRGLIIWSKHRHNNYFGKLWFQEKFYFKCNLQ